MPRCEACGRQVESLMDLEEFDGKDVCALCKSRMESNKAQTEYHKRASERLDEDAD